MTDPVCDMLNRIRNAQAVLRETVEVPFSNLKYEVAKILEKKGFIAKVEKKGRKMKRIIEIALKYDTNQPVISGLRRVSRPGQRIYKKTKEIKLVKGGYGVAVISTPKGLMTDREARKKKLGGEIICEIW
jgi:small subunit ribosomal protein S8